MKVAVIGATGLVGSTMVHILEERQFPVTEFIPVASEKTIDRKVRFRNMDYKVKTIKEALAFAPDIALFSAGSDISTKYAPEFVSVGTSVIDNSSAWRMNPGIKLIIPEVNGDVLTYDDKIIANPNCSTIQLLMVIAPIYKHYGISRVVISTYQSVTGSGLKAIHQLESERTGKNVEKFYLYPIDLNCIPHIDKFESNGYTKEEIKMINESRKILGDPSLRITATAVRVPVMGGHSESVNLELKQSFNFDDLISLLNNTPGVSVINDNSRNQYPMPIYSEGKDEVFVGRIRMDKSQENSLNLWIVADNLRKGAATNTVQIAETLIEKALI